MIELLGLCGPAGSGKSTVARQISNLTRDHAMESLIISFADPIKDMMFALLSYGLASPHEVNRALNDQEGKKTCLDELQGKTPRHAMQTLGVEWGRNLLGTNLWTDIAMRKVEAFDGLVIIDDVRFPSEVAMIEDMGGIVVRLETIGVEYDISHPSEQLLPVKAFPNDGKTDTAAKAIMKYMLDKNPF